MQCLRISKLVPQVVAQFLDNNIERVVSMLSVSLEKAIAEASKLSADEQDTLATWILEEIKSEQRWRKAFSESQNKLSQLADKALKERSQGKTRLLDPEEL
jgi:gamma-glutamyl:cysteine ligase YbdK (ATP-grasp superfamily)